MNALSVISKEMFSFQQGLNGKTVRLIADSCMHLKKLSLCCVPQIDDGDVIHVIDRLGRQLTTLVWVEIVSQTLPIHTLINVPGNMML